MNFWQVDLFAEKTFICDSLDFIKAIIEKDTPCEEKNL